MSIKEDFLKTFGPPPNELPSNMANAMGIDQAIWGARIQGAKWMAEFCAKAVEDNFCLCDTKAKALDCACKLIRNKAKQLEESA